MIIYALGIHSGGGKVLLDHLLLSEMFGKTHLLICDSRYSPPIEIFLKVKIVKIKPNIFKRWKAEYILKKESLEMKGVDILCFSSMPPLFRLSGKTILFFQNALLLPKIKTNIRNTKINLRICYEKFWIRFFINNVDEIWIQSKWMLPFFFNAKVPILLKPFLPELPQPLNTIKKKYRFITVTGNSEHKMLAELLNTWSEISDPKMSLVVVTELPNFKIKNIIETARFQNVHFFYNLKREDVFQLYQECEILLVTSKIESFCLPIYEAHHFNLKIVALRSLFSQEIDFIDYFIDAINKSDIINANKALNV